MRISDWSSDVCSSDLDLQATMTAVKAAKTLPLQDGFFSAHLGATDPELADAIRGELRRQQDQIELIASENVVSLAVLEAQGRSEERRGGKEWVRTGRTRWSSEH